MKKYLFLIICLPSLLFGQQDPKAQKILDAFSKKTKSYKAFSADFVLRSENKQSGEASENKGNFVIMGDKYKISINQMVMYFDGKNTYNFTPESNEVSISNQGKNEDDFFLKNPSKLFSLYAKDFKYRLIGELVYKSRVCYEVDLYPEDFKKKYSIIKLLIDKEKQELVVAKLLMKSGVNYILEISNFNPKAVAVEKDFTFDPSKYKGVEVIDLR